MTLRSKKCAGSRFRQQWVSIFVCFLGLFSSYYMRVCLPITITEMTVHLNKSIKIFNKTNIGTIDEIVHIKNLSSTSRPLFEWSEYRQGIILSSFYWGYILTNLPGGIIAAKSGGKYTLGIGVLISALLTLSTPFAVAIGGSIALIIIRILIGMASGVTFPAVIVLLAQWVPESGRSKAAAIVFAGAALGPIFAFTVSGIILKYSGGNWPLVFYFFGGMGIISFILNTLLCYSKPSQNPFISESELQYLRQNLKTTESVEPRIPWKEILLSKPVWALVFTYTGNIWGYTVIINDMPKFLKSVLHLPVDMNGYLNSLPLLCKTVIGFVASIISDYLIASNKLSITSVRKIGGTISSLGPGTFLLGAAYSGSNYTLVVTFLIISQVLHGFALISIGVNALDLGPNYAGIIIGLSNGISNVFGMFSPYIVGLLTPNQSYQEWQYVFWIVFLFYVITNTVFLIFGSGEVQEWNDRDFRETKNKLDKEEAELL